MNTDMVVAGATLIALPFVGLLVDSLVTDGIRETLRDLFVFALIAAPITAGATLLVVGAASR